MQQKTAPGRQSGPFPVRRKPGKYENKRLQEAFKAIEEKFGVGQSGSYQGVHAETIISNGQPSGYVWTDHSFESLVREDIEKIAAASGISDYNITTVPTPVKPEGFSRIEDPDKDQTYDSKGVSLVGNRTMNLDSNVLNGVVTIKDGRMTVPQDQDVCVISEELALLNNLTVGDRIGFSPVKREGPIQYAEIVGIYQVREPMTPYMSGDTYRSENIIFTNLDFPAKAEQDSPLFEKAYFKVEQVDEYEAVKERIQQTDINWERYDLIDNNGNLDTMASNFNDLEHISQMLLLIIAGASFIILSLIFVFLDEKPNHEIGILMSLGISKLEILFSNDSGGLFSSELLPSAFLFWLLPWFPKLRLNTWSFSRNNRHSFKKIKRQIKYRLNMLPQS